MLLSNAVVQPNFRAQYQQQAEWTPPSYSASISGHFLEQLLEPEMALEKIAPLVGVHPHFATLNEIYDAVQHVTQTEGLPITQKIGDGVASLLGFAFNPINIALGGAGGLLAKGGLKGLAAVSPELLMNFTKKNITQFSKETIGSLSKKALTGASVGAVSLLPENIAESLTKENKIDVSHLIKTTSIAGGLGLALGIVPFAASLIYSKFLRRTSLSETRSEEENALAPYEKSNGPTTKEQTWYQAYQKNPDDPQLIEQAAEILKKNHPDLTINPLDNTVNVSLLTANDLQALRSVIPEELLSREGLKNPKVFSDFIQNNALDRLKKQNPLLSKGLKGILTELEHKSEKDWQPLLSKIIDHIESGPESLADSNAVKDSLKQRIENQLADEKQVEQLSFDAKARLKQYEDTLKQHTELPPMTSQHTLEDSELTKEGLPTIKKYQEFKTQSQVFRDLIQCLGSRL